MEAVIEELPQPPSGGQGLSGREDAEWRGLFEELAAGRPSALEELYDAAAAKLYDLALWRTGSPEDAADVVQDVFVRIAGLGDRLLEVRKPRAWLLTLAHRAAVDLARRRKRRRAEPMESCPFLAADGSDPDRDLDARRASRLLADLPAPQRAAIYLRHFASCTFAEIGRIVGVPKFTAASRYRNGIARLRRLMESE